MKLTLSENSQCKINTLKLKVQGFIWKTL